MNQNPSRIAITDPVKNSDDARNPLSEPYRLDAGCEVAVHDPHMLEYPGVKITQEPDEGVKGADGVAILTGHDEYFRINAGMLKVQMGHEHPMIVEGCNLVKPDGFIGE